MEQIWLTAALWMGLALLAVFVAHWLRLPTAVCEITLGALAPLLLNRWLGPGMLNPSAPWVVFLAGTGSLLLTFSAGTELDPTVLRATWREALLVGLAGCITPLLGTTAAAYYLLGWSVKTAWVTGVCLSSASVSVVYTILLEMGINQTGLGQGLMASSYINNLFSAVAMGLILAPFNSRTLVLVLAAAAIFAFLPLVSSRVLGRLRSRVAQPDLRYLLLLLFGLGGLSVSAGGELILPAYIMGMLLAGLVGRNESLIHNLRVITFGILTPFYFLRAGAQVHIPVLAAAPMVFFTLFAAKMAAKLTGVLPAMRVFAYDRREGVFCSFMMSTGLGLASITASTGLSRGILDSTQYSHIIAAIVGSAVVPVAAANRWFAPRHLFPRAAEAKTRKQGKAKARHAAVSS